MREVRAIELNLGKKLMYGTVVNRTGNYGVCEVRFAYKLI